MNTSDNRSPKILVVEDEPHIGELCRKTLGSQGFEVDIAANGKIARDMIEKKDYDLVFMDLITPEMTGIQLYEWLKTDKPRWLQRVILTTGDVMRGDTQSFLEKAERPLLLKPFTPDELLGIIRQVLKNMVKTTIMAVDDEEFVRQLLQRILEGAGYSVVLAANGREALEKFPGSGASLVLLDIRMPELDGIATLEGIRQQSEIPVIMLTGVREATVIRDTLGLGADDYIEKPFQSGELLARIKAKLRRRMI